MCIHSNMLHSCFKFENEYFKGEVPVLKLRKNTHPPSFNTTSKRFSQENLFCTFITWFSQFSLHWPWKSSAECLVCVPAGI